MLATLMQRRAGEMRAKVQERVSETWQRLGAWSPGQKRMLLVITLLLGLNLVLFFKPAATEEKVVVAQKHERSLGQTGDDEESSGATYVRFGRTVCPQEAALVYEGVTGGGYYHHHGGSANYVCLPLDPDYGYQGVVSNNVHSLMYGTEYQELNPFFTNPVHDHNVPCAVCQSLQRRSVLMVPAKTRCPSGWHPEYTGYLVSSHHGHHSSKTFECLDGEPETDQAGYRNEDGALMYRVDGQCGSLPCPPYEQNKALTCVVCTK